MSEGSHVGFSIGDVATVGFASRRVAAVHIVEVVATCLFLVAVGQIIGGRFEDFAPALGWCWAMGIGGVVAAVAAGAAVSMSGRHARAEEQLCTPKFSMFFTVDPSLARLPQTRGNESLL